MPFISLLVNRQQYRNTIILKYNEEGLYLKTVFVFRLFHEPVFIPWKEIKEVRDKKILFSNFKASIIGNPIVAKLGISESILSGLTTSYRLY